MISLLLNQRSNNNTSTSYKLISQTKDTTMTNFKKISYAILPFILFACASSPTHLIITPDVQITNTVQYLNTQVELNITDMRTSNHIVQILRKDKAATLLSAQEALDSIIKNSLVIQWKKQGILFTANKDDLSFNGKKINIIIRKALVSVKQDMLRYKADTEIIMDVSVKSGNQTLTSTFKNNANSEGPLQADIAVLERDFNQNVGSVLYQILKSADVSRFIQKEIQE